MRGRIKDSSASEVAEAIIAIPIIIALLLLAVFLVIWLLFTQPFIVLCVGSIGLVGFGAYGIGWYLTTPPKPKQKRKRGEVQDES